MNKKPEVKQNKIKTLELYDWIFSSIKGQELMLPPTGNLSNEQIAIEWGRVVSKRAITKMFILEKYSSWQYPGLLQYLMESTINNIDSVRFNYFMNLTPHYIDWNSAKMQQQLKLYARRAEKDDFVDNNIFTQRDTRVTNTKMLNKIKTFEYFNHTDLDFKRSIFKTSLFIEIIGEVNKLEDLDKAISNFKAACIASEIEMHELNADVFDWLRNQAPTSMRNVNNIEKSVPKTIMSDDTVTVLLAKGQGKIGENGIPLGLDVYSSLPVLHVFREDAQKAENILITAGTGGGKSVFVKDKLLWALQQGLSVCVLDFEGDEYTNLAKFINEGNPGDAVIIDIGSGNNRYFDPLRISEAVGEPDLDNTRKTESVEFTKSIFNILLGENGKMTMEEESIFSQVLTKVYSEHGVTDNPNTWHRSHSLKIDMVFTTLQRMVEARTYFIDKSGDDSLQKVAKKMILKLNKYFVPGESEYGLFGEILSLEKIRDARFIVFSFGNKGRDTQGSDTKKLALKQLSVSKITNEISNYNKYVKDKFTIKVWEEVQRFVNIPGAEDIMLNCVTGGRKRGDIAFIITNNLAQLLNGGTDFMKALNDNLTGYCVGYIPSEPTRTKFCETFGMQLFKPDLDTIYYETASTIEKTSSGQYEDSPFKSSFLVKMLPTSKSPAIQTIVKAIIAQPIFDKHIFDPGKLETAGDILI